MRLVEGGAIGNRRRIEHDDISAEHSFLERTTMIEAEIRGKPLSFRIACGNVITFSSRTYFPSTRGRNSHRPADADSILGTCSGACEASSEPNEIHGFLISFFTFSSDMRK